MNELNPQVDQYLDRKAQRWQRPILDSLRQSIVDCGLQEEIKWGSPVYCQKGNVVGMSAFKNHCGLWFFEGALLADAAGVLINAQEGKTKALRQWRFFDGDVVDEPLVKAYVMEAAGNMEKGIRTVKKGSNIKVLVPEMLGEFLDSDTEVKEYFNSLAPSHRRDFSEHISSAKQEATKHRRLEKVKTLLLAKKGLHDQYKKC